MLLNALVVRQSSASNIFYFVICTYIVLAFLVLPLSLLSHVQYLLLVVRILFALLSGLQSHFLLAVVRLLGGIVVVS